MSSDLWLGIETTDVVLLHYLNSLMNIVDFQADMVHAAERIFLEEAGNGRVGTERLQEFDFGVVDIDKDDGHTVFRKVFRL